MSVNIPQKNGSGAITRRKSALLRSLKKVTLPLFMVMVVEVENAMVSYTAAEQKVTTMAFTILSHLHCLLSRPPDPRSRKNRERLLTR